MWASRLGFRHAVRRIPAQPPPADPTLRCGDSCGGKYQRQGVGRSASRKSSNTCAARTFLHVANLLRSRSELPRTFLRLARLQADRGLDGGEIVLELPLLPRELTRGRPRRANMRAELHRRVKSQCAGAPCWLRSCLSPISSSPSASVLGQALRPGAFPGSSNAAGAHRVARAVGIIVCVRRLRLAN